MKRTNSGSVAEESVSMRETEGEREKGHHSSIVFGVGYGEVLTRVEEERLHLRRDDRPLKFEQLSQQCTRALFCRGMRQEKKNLLRSHDRNFLEDILMNRVHPKLFLRETRIHS
jgi:hypothetical protein